MSPGPGKVASFFPVGPIATDNSADQTSIVTFTRRFFWSSWKNVTEDANLWGLFLTWKQQKLGDGNTLLLSIMLAVILGGIVQAPVFSIYKNKHTVTAAYLIRQLEHWIYSKLFGQHT